MNLETKLQLQATENHKATTMHELRSKEFNLVFHGIPMKDKSETSETSEKIIVRCEIPNHERPELHPQPSLPC